MRPRARSLKRRIRSAGGTLLRRLGALPGGMPDGLGDDDVLADAVLEGDVLVFFPDTAESLYQLRGWYGPLGALHSARGVTVVCMDSRVAATIRSELEAPVVTIARDATLDAIIARSEIRLILYVNYNPLNTAALRTRSAIHANLLHGDSDKAVSVSNQVKAYDFSFVAGRAAIDRYARYTSLFDAEARCIPVGRPALDTDAVDLPEYTPLADRDDPRPTVLYAPTWEGGQTSVAYSSLLTHADALLRSLQQAGMRVLYRPHPLTGVRDPQYGQADAALRELIAASAGEGHAVSEGTALQEDFAWADLLISDVSAVVTEWLPTGRPVIVTSAGDPRTQEASTPLLRALPRLAATEAGEAGSIAAHHLREDPAGPARATMTEYYLGDTAPGASLQRFLQACHDLTTLRDTLWAQIGAAAEPALTEPRSPEHVA